MKELDKIPPQAVDIEKVVLGAMLLESDCIDSVTQILKGPEFYNPSHETIFKAIIELSNSGKPVDLLTVIESLGENLKKVGGAVYLSELTSRVVSGSHAGYHAAIIKDKWVARQLISQASKIGSKAYDSDVHDVLNEYYSSAVELQGVYISNKRGRDASVIAYMATDEYYKREKANYQGGITGVITPIRKINEITGGWQPGNMITIAARPSMGKTAVALACAKTAIEHGHTVVFYSLEMTELELVNRLLLSISGIDPERFKHGKLNDSEKQDLESAIGTLEKMNLIIDDTPSITISEIHAKCRILKKQKGALDLVIIDYLKLVGSSKKKGR